MSQVTSVLNFANGSSISNLFAKHLKECPAALTNQYLNDGKSWMTLRSLQRLKVLNFKRNL